MNTASMTSRSAPDPPLLLPTAPSCGGRFNFCWIDSSTFNSCASSSFKSTLSRFAVRVALTSGASMPISFRRSRLMRFTRSIAVPSPVMATGISARNSKSMRSISRIGPMAVSAANRLRLTAATRKIASSTSSGVQSSIAAISRTDLACNRSE